MTVSRCFIFMYFLLPHWVQPHGQPGADQHKGRVAVRETAHYTGAAADLPVQPLNDIVGADTGAMLTGKITVGQSLLYTASNQLLNLPLDNFPV